MFPPFCYKFYPFDSLFHAELYAIYFAVRRTVGNYVTVCIRSEFLSSILVFGEYNCILEFVNLINRLLEQNMDNLRLSWVKTHAGTFENKIPHHFAKLVKHCV